MNYFYKKKYNYRSDSLCIHPPLSE